MYMMDGSVISGIWKQGVFQGSNYNQSMIQNVTENFIPEDSKEMDALDAAKNVKVWAVVVWGGFL